MTYLNNDLSQVCLLFPMLCWRIIQRVRSSRQEGKRAVEDDDSDGTNEEENEADESYEALPRQECELRNSLRPFMTFHAWPFHFIHFSSSYIYIYICILICIAVWPNVEFARQVLSLSATTARDSLKTCFPLVEFTCCLMRRWWRGRAFSLQAQLQTTTNML